MRFNSLISTQNQLLRRTLIKKISKINSSGCPTCAKKKHEKELEEKYGHNEARKINLIEGLEKIKNENKSI